MLEAKKTNTEPNLDKHLNHFTISPVSYIYLYEICQRRFVITQFGSASGASRTAVLTYTN